MFDPWGQPWGPLEAEGRPVLQLDQKVAYKSTFEPIIDLRNYSIAEFASFFMQIHVVDLFFHFVEVRFVTVFEQRAAAADGPDPDLDPGPGPEIFQLSGRP